MSNFAVKVERIRSVEKHPNADRLDLIQVNDWRCVSTAGKFNTGDLCVYFPIDSLLPEGLETHIFGPDAKVKLTKSRVRTIKLRGAVSQGLAISMDELTSFMRCKTILDEGYDLTAHLGVKKYEPPEPPAQMGGQAVSKKEANPYFEEYGGIDNGKHYPDLFQEGELVYISEKIHGTNFRAGWVPFYANTWWKKVLQFLRLAPTHEFVYGSNHVQLQSKKFNGYYSSNVYAEAVEKYRLKEILAPGEVLYGEVYGDGIQTGYTYGCKPGEHKAIFFDLMLNGVYQDHLEFFVFCDIRKLPRVPVLHTGFYEKDKAKELTKGPSVLEPSQKVREGIVIKPFKEESCLIGRKIVKLISEEYLLKDQSEFH